MKTRVLVVDDSAVFRRVLVRGLSADPDILVVGTAEDAFAARDKIVTLAPDVVTLDIEMPRMDGITFLRQLMTHYPIPVIVVSSFAAKASDRAIAALAAGGLDVVCKPGAGFEGPDLQYLIRTIKAAAAVRFKMPEPVGSDAGQGVDSHGCPGACNVAVIGASTGGPKVLRDILCGLHKGAPPILVAQHMPQPFIDAFASHLQASSPLKVKRAEHGDALSPGRVLIAPGDCDMVLGGGSGAWRVELLPSREGKIERPSIDRLFLSAAQHAGRESMGVLLSGMGTDGAAGLLEMRKRGAFTIAQDAASCAVYGMPREAVEKGAAMVVAHPGRIAEYISKSCGPVAELTAAGSRTKSSTQCARK